MQTTNTKLKINKIKSNKIQEFNNEFERLKRRANVGFELKVIWDLQILMLKHSSINEINDILHKVYVYGH